MISTLHLDISYRHQIFALGHLKMVKYAPIVETAFERACYFSLRLDLYLASKGKRLLNLNTTYTNKGNLKV